MTCVTRFFFSVYCWGHQTCKYLKEHIPVVHPLSLHCTQAGTHTHTYTHKPFSLNLISLVLKLLQSSTGQWPPTTYPEQSGQSLSMWVGRVTLSRVALAMAVGLKRGTPARHRCSVSCGATCEVGLWELCLDGQPLVSWPSLLTIQEEKSTAGFFPTGFVSVKHTHTHTHRIETSYFRQVAFWSGILCNFSKLLIFFGVTLFAFSPYKAFQAK